MSVLATVDEFVRSKIIGHERELDRFVETPHVAHGQFQALGLSNWWLPSDVGGLGVSLVESVDVVASLAYGDAGLAFTALISILGTTFVDLFGSSEQRARWLSPLAKAPRSAAAAASERGAGSELIGMETTARLDGAAYTLDGPKFFSTNAAFADFVVVVARVPGTPRDDYKALVVERGAKGLNVKRRWETIGLRSSSTYELELQGCSVSAANVLSGHGLRALEVALNPSRILIAALGIGVGMRLRDTCLEYAKTKTVHKQSLLANSAFAAKIGQMEMEIEAIRHVCRAAAAEFDEACRTGRPKLLRTGALESAVVAKMLSGQLGWKMASVASEAFGGLGYTEDSIVGKLVRDMRVISIIEAGDDVLRELLFQRYAQRRVEGG